MPGPGEKDNRKRERLYLPRGGEARDRKNEPRGEWRLQMSYEEKTILERYLFRGKILKLRKDKIRLPNGRTSIREVVEHPGGVGVVPLDAQENVIMVRQYRYPYRKELLEIPAGKLTPGEEPLDCGKRELKEETGAEAGFFIDLGKLLPSPGYTNEIIYLFLAQALTEGEQQPDEDEFLDIVRIPLRQAVDMVLSGEIADSKTQIALLKTWIMLKKD